MHVLHQQWRRWNGIRKAKVLAHTHGGFGGVGTFAKDKEVGVETDQLDEEMEAK